MNIILEEKVNFDKKGGRKNDEDLFCYLFFLFLENTLFTQKIGSKSAKTFFLLDLLNL